METKKPKRRANPLQILIGYAIGLGMVLAGVYFSSLTPLGPLPEALPYLQSNQLVQVIPGDYAYFLPAGQAAQTGFILYPGGRVDYRSYAPFAALLAEKGWPAAIVRMPLNLAVLGADRASQVMADHPEIHRWVIGGHSLGGTMAAQFAIKNPEKIAGIVFMASYPEGKELATSTIPLLSIYGSADGLISKEDWGKYKNRFSPSTQWIIIDGGNHAGFGWYGKQDGDKPAAISLQNQTDQIIQAVDQFLQIIDNSYW
jgi:pimeloyl-ACP methyl ester carboxylesterase